MYFLAAFLPTNTHTHIINKLGILLLTKFLIYTVLLNISLTQSLGDAAVWRLPSAQGAILETRDRIPRRAPGAWSLLLPLPVPLPLSLSLSVSHEQINEILKKKKSFKPEIFFFILVSKNSPKS